MADGSTRSYDPNVIIRAATDKLAANDVAGGQTLFQSALLNWVDDARENYGRIDPDQMREAIATLWISYAQFNVTAKQFKSATEAFEQATECPISGAVGRIWVEYGRFLEERNKLRSAQQMYIRALHGNGGKVTDEQDRALLWNEFLEMMRKKSPDLTLHELKQAIQEEHSGSGAGAAPDVTGSSGEPTSNRPRIYSADSIGSNGPAMTNATGSSQTGFSGAVKQENETHEVSRTHVVTPADVENELQTLQNLSAQNDPAWKATWMVRDGPQPPQPPINLFNASPPKLSDPTGKDLLGDQLALAMIERLLQPDGSVVLQIARGLWMLTAMKEQASVSTIKSLDDSIKEEWKTLEGRLDERLSVAGAAEQAVRQMNEAERSTFQANCQQKRVETVSKIAWDFRQLLWMQQQLLLKVNVPGIRNVSYDDGELEMQQRVCSYLHSAFFLRQRIGKDAHSSMLKSQLVRLQQHIKDNPPPPTTQQSPMRQNPPPPQPHSLPPPPVQHHYMQHAPPQQQLAPPYGGMVPPPPPPQPQYAAYPGQAPPPPPPGMMPPGYNPPYYQQ